MTEQSTFVRLQDSTFDDWQRIRGEFMAYAQKLPMRVIDHLKLLQGDFGGFPVDRYTHSLQTATRAFRDGRDEEYVVCALLHDIGDTLSTYNHADIAVVILGPFVSDANLWMIQNHNVFQGYFYFHHIDRDRHLRERFAGHPHYQRTAEFCEHYDSAAFDVHGETLPLSTFEPMLYRVMASPRRLAAANTLVSSHGPGYPSSSGA